MLRKFEHKASSSRFTRRGRRRRAVAATVLVTLASAAVLGAVTLAVVVLGGWYNVAAVVQHWQSTYTLMQTAMYFSVRHHARGIATPALTGQMVRRGVVVYEQQCLQCHGAPGIPPGPMGLSMQPLPGPLVHMMQHWKPREIYWIVSNGIKMTGMPAWQHRLSEDDMWAVTALVARLPDLSVQDYAALTSTAAGTPAVPSERPGDRLAAEYRAARVSAERGKAAIPQYACQSCHVIPGIVGGKVHVGPPLDHYARRKYIAGYLPNTQDNLVSWLRAPQKIKPHSAMPDLDVSEQDAEDISAYLLSR